MQPHKATKNWHIDDISKTVKKKHALKNGANYKIILQNNRKLFHNVEMSLFKWQKPF